MRQAEEERQQLGKNDVFDGFRHGNGLLERSREEEGAAREGGVGGDGGGAGGVEDSREEGSEEGLEGLGVFLGGQAVRDEIDDEEEKLPLDDEGTLRGLFEEIIDERREDCE